MRQARQTIRKLRRERPDARIVVTGCAAQTEPETFAAMPEVDRVLGNEEKLSAAAWAGLDAAAKIAVGDIMAATDDARCIAIDGIEGHTRAFVQVQNGCDHRCTFCIIPFGRGNSRSVPMDDVVAQVRRLVDERLPRDRADRRRHHELRRDRRRSLGAAGEADPAATCRS